MTIIILFALLLVTLAILSWKSSGGTFHAFDAASTLPLRGLAAMLVVLYHVACNEREVAFFHHFLMLGDLSVCLFFFISGYGLMVSYINKRESYLEGFLSRRFIKILPAFLIATIGYEIFQSLHSDHSTLESLTAIVHGGTMLPDSWFVITIMIYYLIFYSCARFFHKPSALVISLWVSTVIYITSLVLLGWESYWYKTIVSINIGSTYALLEPHIKHLITKHPRYLVVGASTITLLIIAIGVAKQFGLSALMLVHFLMPLLAVACVYATGRWSSRALNRAGTISFEIYIMQCIWRHVLYTTSTIHWSVYLVVTFAITIITAWLLHSLCNSLTRRR